MTASDIRPKIRPATSADAPALAKILNAIIAAGRTTALETAVTASELDEHFISAPNCFICFVAEVFRGEAHGFQTLIRSSALPAGWADIGTFTRRNPLIPGVGTALFEHTKRAAVGLGIRAISATIRADNAGGLRFYAKLGFRNYQLAPAVPLLDGTPVDRISKVFRFRISP